MARLKMASLHRRLCLIIMFLIGPTLLSCSSTSAVRTRLLQETPVGTSFEQVWNFCVAREKKCYQSLKAGYLNQDTGKIVGVYSIWANIDEQKLKAGTITAYWGFGSDSRLIDVWVWRTIDAP